MLDQQSRRFGRTPIKEGASGHVSQSGEEKLARILPYLPPAKSVGAKTNHLPNIQGEYRLSASTGWAWNNFPGAKTGPARPPKD
jgi:hypothetical protein